jgi:hypothetical protein
MYLFALFDSCIHYLFVQNIDEFPQLLNMSSSKSRKQSSILQVGKKGKNANSVSVTYLTIELCINQYLFERERMQTHCVLHT